MAWGLSAAALLRGGLMLGYALWPHAQRSHEQVETQEEVTQEEVTWSTRELLAYGLPLSMSAIVGKLNVQADKYLIAALTTAEVYAIYHVGAIELPLVYGVAYSVTNALTPHLITRYHEGDREGFLSLWHTSVHKVASLIMPVAFYLMCFATEVISLAFSERYIDAALPFRVYLLLLPLRLCSYGAVVRATGVTRPVFTATLLSLVSNLLLNYPLYQLLGVVGPALSSVIAQIVAISLLLKTLKTRLEVRWGEVFPFKSLAALLLTSGLTALVAWALTSTALSALSLESRTLALTLGGLLQLPLYLWLGLKSSLLSREDLSFIYGALTLKRARAALRRRLKGAAQ
jgi:O-antigen/teichoic acid export membrane protein